MDRRYNLSYLILASVVVLVLTPLMADVDAQVQARIAFVSDRNGNFEIYVMDANGKNQRRLTNNRHSDGSPSWSPDGRRIVFESNRDGNREIYVMDADGGKPKNFTKNRHSDGPLKDVLPLPTRRERRNLRDGCPLKTLPIIPMMTGILHGPPAVNGLPLFPLGLETGKST